MARRPNGFSEISGGWARVTLATRLAGARAAARANPNLGRSRKQNGVGRDTKAERTTHDEPMITDIFAPSISAAVLAIGIATACSSAPAAPHAPDSPVGPGGEGGGHNSGDGSTAGAGASEGGVGGAAGSAGSAAGGAPGGNAGSSAAGSSGGESGNATRRVPAEWEPQASVWMQWPHGWESHYVPVFVEIVAAISAHEPVHLIATSSRHRARGEEALSRAGVDTRDVTWHSIPTDNAWMRDNGPRYVFVDGQVVVQDWGFDAWGGNFGTDVLYESDDAVPVAVAAYLGLPVEEIDLIHERGDLEFNGAGTVIASWSVLSDRNPGIPKGEITTTLEQAFGVDSVVYIEGHLPEDGTTGHTDGLARFISVGDVVVGQISNPERSPEEAALFDAVADQIAAQRPDLNIHRLPFPAGTDYMNWLVGNGVVVAGSFGRAQADASAKQALEKFFPGRTVTMVDVSPLWADGGGVHCVTNDQPAAQP